MRLAGSGIDVSAVGMPESVQTFEAVGPDYSLRVRAAVHLSARATGFTSTLFLSPDEAEELAGELVAAAAKARVTP